MDRGGRRRRLQKTPQPGRGQASRKGRCVSGRIYLSGAGGAPEMRRTMLRPRRECRDRSAVPAQSWCRRGRAHARGPSPSHCCCFCRERRLSSLPFPPNQSKARYKTGFFRASNYANVASLRVPLLQSLCIDNNGAFFDEGQRHCKRWLTCSPIMCGACSNEVTARGRESSDSGTRAAPPRGDAGRRRKRFRSCAERLRPRGTSGNWALVRLYPRE
jgi:hypothetical protein